MGVGGRAHAEGSVARGATTGQVATPPVLGVAKTWFMGEATGWSKKATHRFAPWTHG